MTRIIILLSMVALLSSNVKAQLNLTPITQLLTDSIAAIGQLGQNAAFIIIRNDTIIYQNYWGTWNNNTYQPIASGSKLPSMALIMRLIDEGYLSPSDTVQNYLPSFSGKPIMTLHQLMSHTSGLPGQSSFISDNNISLTQAVNSIGTSTPMTSYAPGTAFQYGGVSMHVAGRMAEIATGIRWDSLFQQKIGIPLGLSNTDYLGLGNTTNFRIAGGMGTTMPDFAKILNMLLKYGKHNNTQIIDSLTVRMMQNDQTNGVPLIGTPYAGDPLRQNFRYGYGVWLEEETNGQVTQYGSQGAFGFTPWIDRCRNIVCVLFVRKTVSGIQPTHTQLRNLVEQLIPIKLQKPIITANGNTLQSSHQHGNQWYLNNTILQGETNPTLHATQNGIYKVKYISPEGCEVISDEFSFTLIETYNVTISASPTSGGTTTGGGSYASGASVTLTATANSGYTFVDWTENGNQVSTDASYTFNISADRSLVANFDAITGINKIENSLVKVYPNPSTGRVFIDTSTEGELVVYNYMGQQIQTKSLREKQNEIIIYETGVYLLMFIEKFGNKTLIKVMVSK